MAPQHMRSAPATATSGVGEHVSERASQPDPPLRLLLWACLLLGELWCAYKILTQWVRLPINHLHQSLELFDFRYYYIAALALRINPHANIYDASIVATVAHASHLPVPTNPLGYPLLLPVVLIPLTVFSYQTAAHIWDLCDIALWAVNSLLLVDWLRIVLLGERRGIPGRDMLAVLPRRPSDWTELPQRLWDRWTRIPTELHFAVVLALVISFMSGPMLNSIFLGQISMFMLTCFLLVPWLIRRGHPMVAGALITIVALIKVVPVVLLGYYLLRGRWRVVAGAAGALAICLIGITALVGVPNVLAMRQIVSLSASAAGTSYQSQALAQAPMWIAVMFGGRPSAETARLGLAVIAIVGAAFTAVVLWLTWRAHGDNTRLDALTFTTTSTAFDATMHEWLGYAWALSTMILVSPVTWEHHDIWLLPPFVVALGYALRRTSFGRARFEVCVVLLVVVGLALTANGLPFGYEGITSFSIGPYINGQPLRPFFMLLRPCGTLLIWGAIGALFWRTRPGIRPARGMARIHRDVAESGIQVELSGAVNSHLAAAPVSPNVRRGVADGVLLYGLICTVAALELSQVILHLITAAVGPG